MLRRSLSRPAAVLVAGLLLLAGRSAADNPKGVEADRAANQPPKGFTAIFNGKDLTGWHGWAIHEAKMQGPYALAKLSPEERQKKIDQWTEDAKKHWTVENGELVNDGHGAYLATDKGYGDIEFFIEYKTVPKADSGIYLRATPQVQIWDHTVRPGADGQDKGSGGLWNNTKGTPGRDPLVLADKPFGEWNKFHIIMVGEYVTVWLNDKLVVDHARLENYWDKQAKKNPPGPLPKKAPILLQTHGGEIRWRNIFIREIPPDEANEILRKKAGSGFKPLFDGKTLTGWTGAVDNYEVKDGAIVCKKGKGGNLYTEEEFSDFVALAEYKLPPGGNNGFAIRYPGKGQPSEVAMCEIQVLDDNAPKHAKLDPRQYNGSIYGMVAARRGYERPIGEWNFQVMTVRGPKITVELNGTRIVDADVSQVKDFMAGHKHPGKDRTSGHFGFAGHNDPVAFRNIEIKPLTASSQR